MIKSLLFLAALGLVYGLKVPHPDCPESGDHLLLPHEYDCTKFYYCEGGQKFVEPRPCPPGTEFSNTLQVCIHPILANCTLPGAPPSEGTEVPATQPPATQPPATDPPAPQPPATNPPAPQPPATNPPAPQPPATNPPATQAPTTAASQGTTDCERFENGCPVDFDINQYFEHETSCRLFYRCVNGERVLQKCPRGTAFSIYLNTCDHAINVDRTCEDTESSEEEPPAADDEESREIEFLENGCPVDSSISWHLPHENYCNVYYRCIFGERVWATCPPGTQFNPSIQVCDHASNVNCRLPGGNINPTTTTPPPTAAPTTRPPIDLDQNGCPVDPSISWLVPHENCNKFYFCVHGSLVVSSCPSGLHFSPTLQRCENPAIAGCANGPCGDKDVCDGNNGGENDNVGGDDNNDVGGDDNNDVGGDDNNDVGGDDNNGVGGDDNNDVGGDDNNNVGGDDNNDVGGDDNNDVGGDENNNVGGDDNNNVGDDDESGEDNIADDDYVPCDDVSEQDKKCVEECQVLPWAHEDCDKFWTCYGNKAQLGICSNGLFFNPSTNTCDFACNVDCDSSRVRVSPHRDGLKMYIPWHRLDNKAKQLLKLISQN